MAEIHWANAVSADFATAADWTGGAVPGPSDDAILDAKGSPYTVTASTGQSVESIQTAANAVLLIKSTFGDAGGTGAGANAGTINVDGTLTAGGIFDNTGAVALDIGALTVAAGGLTLSGGGSVLLGLSGGVVISGVAPGAMLTNIDNTISGGGEIQQLTLVNEAGGVITAISTRLTLDTGHSITNAGLIEASGGTGDIEISDPIDNTGTLLANSSGITLAPAANINSGLIEGAGLGLDSGGVLVQGTLDQTGGGVLEASGGQGGIGLFSATIIGGTLESDGGFVIAEGGASILDGRSQAITDDANVEIDSGASLTLEGSVINNGTMGGLGELIIGAAGVTLESSAAPSSWSVSCPAATPTSTLTNGNRIRLDPNSDLGGGSMTLVNDGTIKLKGGPGVIDTGANTIMNSGTIKTTGVTSSTLVVRSLVDNTGILETNGGLLRFADAVTGSGDAVIEAGTLIFKSSFEENVAFNGTTGYLDLHEGQSYTGTITGFSPSGREGIDVKDVGQAGPVTLSYAGDHTSFFLTVTDGVNTAHLHIVCDYTNASFEVGSQPDAQLNTRPGTSITCAPAPLGMASVMASFGAPAAAAPAHPPSEARMPAALVLARP